MQEFRPADVIEQDTLLAQSLADGDVDAFDRVVDRYGRAVQSVAATAQDPEADSEAAGSDSDSDEFVLEVFSRVWHERSALAPRSDFGRWIGEFASERAGVEPDAATVPWSVAMAIDAIDDEYRARLRAYHVAGDDLPDEASRHELRLRRRLGHLGDDVVVSEALAVARRWESPPPELRDRLHERLGLGGAEPAISEAPDEIEFGYEPGRVTRSLRPVLLGLAGAVVVIFVAIVALSAASGSADPVVLTADLVPTGAVLDVDGGEVTVTERDAGLQWDLEALTLPRRAGDQFYEAVLVLDDGTELPIGTFNEGLGVTLSAGIPLDRIEMFLVVTGDFGVPDSDVVLKLDVPQT